MATKLEAKKASPVRGSRTATHKAATASPSGMDKQWRAQEDVHHLKRAAEVKADPARHKAAQAEASNQLKALQTVVKK